MDAYDLVRKIRPDGTFDAHDVIEFIESVGRLERAAWDTTPLYAQNLHWRLRDEKIERQHAKAHALCDVLGDQEGLWRQVEYLKSYVLPELPGASSGVPEGSHDDDHDQEQPQQRADGDPAPDGEDQQDQK